MTCAGRAGVVTVGQACVTAATVLEQAISTETIASGATTSGNTVS